MPNLQIITEIVVVGAVLVTIFLTLGPRNWANAVVDRLRKVTSVGGVTSVAFLGLALIYAFGVVAESLSYELTDSQAFVFLPNQVGRILLPGYRKASKYGGTHSALIAGVYEGLYEDYSSAIPNQQSWGPPEGIHDPILRFRGWAANIQAEHITRNPAERISLQRFDTVSRIMRGLLVDFGGAVLLASAAFLQSFYAAIRKRPSPKRRSPLRMAALLAVAIFGFVAVDMGWASAEIGFHSRVWFATQELLLERTPNK